MVEFKIMSTLTPLETVRVHTENDEEFRVLMDKWLVYVESIFSVREKNKINKLYSELANKLVLPALVVLGRRHQNDGGIGAELFPPNECAQIMLTYAFDFIEETIVFAQKTIYREMHRVGLGVKAKDARSTERKKITQGVNRVLTQHSIRVNFSSRTIEDIHFTCKENSNPRSEQARRECASALSLNFDAALLAFKDLSVGQLESAIATIQAYKAVALPKKNDRVL